MAKFDPHVLLEQLSETQMISLQQALQEKLRNQALADIARIVQEYGITEDEIRQALSGHRNAIPPALAEPGNEAGARGVPPDATTGPQALGPEAPPHSSENKTPAQTSTAPIKAVDAASFRRQVDSDPNPVPGADQFHLP